jgi:hypothetical protein
VNRQDALRAAAVASNEDMVAMMVKARQMISNWKAESTINRAMDRGTAFNIFAKLDFSKPLDLYIKRNMIIEFGAYLRIQLPEKPKREKPSRIHHEEPIAFPIPEQEAKP